MSRIAWLVGFSLVLALASSVPAEDPPSNSDAPAVKPEAGQKTICVPQIVMEPRKVQVIECRPEWRECPVTIVNYVPVTTWIDKDICVMNPERRITTICQRVCKPIIEKQDITYCASEPVHCTKMCSRTVCKPMPVKVNRTVCVDEGHWIEKPCCKDPCQLECGPQQVKKEWCPKLVQKNICVTTWKPQMVQECYEKTITTMRCATRTSSVNVITGYISECQTREIQCTVCVPQILHAKVPCITFKCEEIPYTKRYCVLVPHCVEKEIMVPVCRMVKMTIPSDVPGDDGERLAKLP